MPTFEAHGKDENYIRYQFDGRDWSHEVMKQNPTYAAPKYLPPNTDMTGMSGAWVRRDSDYAKALIRSQPYFGSESDVWIAPDSADTAGVWITKKWLKNNRTGDKAK